MACESATKRGEIKHALIACTLMREEKMDQPIAILEIRGGLIIER